MMDRRALIGGAAALAGSAALAACGSGGGNSAESAAHPTSLVFSILSAENQSNMEPLWQPLLNDMAHAVGVPIRPFFASNYTALIEAMRAGQVQVGWFSALPALQATRRANADVVGRIVTANGGTSYNSVLIVRRGSGITLDRVLACGKHYSFGIGDAQSTSGTLAPLTYLFAPRNITPTDCFSTVRSASHQANFFAVANGVIDVATNNSVGLVFAARENPEIAHNVETIWQSPPLPESAILVRRDLDPALKERIRQFFLTYGVGTGPDAVRQQGVLRALEYGGFQAADNSYLDPVRLMEASTALAEARRGSDQQAISRAQAAFDQVQREIAAHGTHPQ